MDFWQEIPFVRLAYTYRCQEDLQLPPYKGSAWRGALGHALKKVTCALRRASCAECLLRQTCVYVYVFETPPPPDSQRLRLYPAAPHPFVLRPPLDQRQRFAPGDELSGELLLIGRAMEYLPYFVYTLEVLGQEGLGRGRGRAALLEVKELDHRQQIVGDIYASTTGLLSAPRQAAWRQTRAAAAPAPRRPLDLSLEFLTPVRLKYQGRFLERLEFHHLIRNLLRRLASLAYFHCGLDPEAFPFKETIRTAEQVASTASQLQWLDWERYSSRQQSRMLMGGLVGKMHCRQVPPQFLSLLHTGEHLHVGKMASFGLGQYRVEIETNFSGGRK